MKKHLVKVKNKQKLISRNFWILSIVFTFLLILPFIEGNPITGLWALAFVSLFMSISCVLIALLFWNRTRKMNSLLNGEKLISSWEMDDKMLLDYITEQRKESKAKNKAIMWVIGILFVVITLPFLFFLESDEMGIFLVIIGSVVTVVFCASRFFPWYYYIKNRKGDKQILIGKKYAYINGYFHNWDYSLSGLTKAKVINTPFYGILLAYYYTDRTWQHSYEMKIPTPESVDLKLLINQIKSVN